MRDGLVKARWPILGLALFLCAGIAFYLSTYWGAVAAAAVEAGVIALCAALGVLWLLRSWQLALVALLATLVPAVLALGVLAPIAIAVPSLCGVLIPHAIATILLTATGVVIAIQYGFAQDICTGSDPDEAAWRAVRQVAMPAIMALVAASLWRIVLLLPDVVMRFPVRAVQTTDVTVLATGVAALCAALVCFLLLPLALGVVRFGEGLITNVNRVREWRKRVFDGLVFVTAPRWALSLIGIAVVFGAIAFLGDTRHPSSAWRMVQSEGLRFPATVVAIGLIGAVALRDWRTFFACALPPAFAATIVAAVSLHMRVAVGVDVGRAFLPGVAGADLLCVSAAVGAGFSLWIAAKIAAGRQSDDPLTVAFARTLDQTAAPLACVAAVAALALAPLGLWYVPLVVALTGVFLTPALTAAIETVFPKLKSVEELYGKTRTEPR